MSQTREQKRRERIVIAGCVLSVLSIMWIIVFSVYLSVKDAEACQEIESRSVCKNSSWVEDHPHPQEDPNEPEMIAQAVISTIGTDAEEACFGYSATYVMRVLTAECGHDGTLAYACATALFNECKALEGRYSPQEALEIYKWCKPVDFITDEAREAFIKVHVYGHMDESIGNATMFYNPLYTVGTPTHESMTFVTEINGVRFFEECD